MPIAFYIQFDWESIASALAMGLLRMAFFILLMTPVVKWLVRHIPRVANIYLLAVLCLSSYLSYQQAYVFGGSMAYDVHGHIDNVKNILNNHFVFMHMGMHYVTIALHFLFAWPVENAFVAVMVLCTTLTYLMVYLVLHYYLHKDFTPAFIAFLTAGLLLVSGLYIPFLTGNIFLGIGGGNIYHSPTFMAMKPFAFAAFALCVYIMERNILRFNREVLLFSLSLVIGTFMKPNFTASFLPALGIYLLAKHPRQYRLYALLAVACLPTVVLFLWQWSMHSYGSQISFLGVWKIYARYPFLSLLQASTFPVSILIARARKGNMSPGLLLAWVNFAIATLMYAFFAEIVQFGSGNFGWGYCMALSLLFLYSSIEWMKWGREEQMALKDNSQKSDLRPFIIVTCIFLYHVFSGLIYLQRLMQGGGIE